MPTHSNEHSAPAMPAERAAQGGSATSAASAAGAPAAAASVAGTYCGRLAGLTEEQRAAELQRFERGATQGEHEAELQELVAHALVHEPEDRFSYMLMERSVEELRVMAADYGAKNAERLGHGDLVTLVCAAASNDRRDCELALEVCDGDQFQSIAAALDKGGRLEFTAAQAARHARVRPFPPYSFLYLDGDRFTLLITDVFKENLATLDRKRIAARRERNERLTACATGLVELYGMVEAHTAHELYNEWHPADALGFGEFAGIVIREAQSQRYSFVCWSNGVKDYLVHYTLLGAAGPGAQQAPGEQQAQALQAARERIIAGHAQVPMRPAERELVCGDVYAWKRGLPAVRELREYLDAHVPQGESDWVFADRTVDELLFALASTPSAQAACELLAEAGLGTLLASDRVLRELAEALAEELPSWDLNGWSAREQRERSSASLAQLRSNSVKN